MEPSPPSSTPHLLDELLLARASSRALAPYLLDARTGRTLSYVELLEEVVKLRNRLRAWGVSRGNRFGLQLGDPLTFSRWFLAGVAMGAWVAPLDSTLSDSNLRTSTRGRRTLV